MAILNGNFRGIIDGKTLYDYSSKFDFDLKTMKERMELVKEIFNLVNIDGREFTDEEFWQEIWDMGICKAGINTTDPLWSDTNISAFLEKCADYLLAVDKQDKNEQRVKIYKDKELFKRMIKEQDKMIKTADANQSEMLVFVNPNKNYKLAKDIVVDKKDIEKYPEIKAYHELRKYMHDLHMNPKKRESLAKRKNLSSRSLMSMLNKNRRLLDDDMLDVKISKDRPVIWKSPLKDSGNEIDWDYLDMFDPNHVKALLQVNKDIDISNEMLISRDELLKKVELTDKQSGILDLWKKDKTQEDIGLALGVSRQVVVSQLKKIVNKVIDVYEKEYAENHYYLNVVKGKYKKCSKCNNIKLVQEFHKEPKGKDGYKSKCKMC
ncbi:MAG: helix-turn-helix transcriptional regulator [Paraclostridium sp.]